MRIPGIPFVLAVSSFGVVSAYAQSVSAPVFLPSEGFSATNLQVIVTSATPGATIRYTTNGAEPVPGDPLVVAGSAIEIRRNTTLKAKAWANSGPGADSSATTVREFEITGDIAAGKKHALALKSAGALFAWGTQENGRLGNGVSNTSNATSPGPSLYSPAVPIADAFSIAAGSRQSVFVDSSASRYAWAFGYNYYGELGNNDSASSEYAVRVVKSTTANDWLTGCAEAAAGEHFSGVRTTDGKVYTWGNQANGRLGSGGLSGSRRYATPVETNASTDLTGIAGIEFGEAFGLAREANALEQPGSAGQVWAWGWNVYAQLGVGDATNKVYATRMKLNSSTYLTDAWDVSGGDLHSVVVRWKNGDPNLQGSVWCVGHRAAGRLGNNGSLTGYSVYPVQVEKADGSPLLNIVEVSSSATHNLALDTSGQVWAWGGNAYGQLGDNTAVDKNHAVQVKNPAGTGYLTGITHVAASGDGTAAFSLALGADGTVYTWGCNTQGQLANGASDVNDHPLPVAVANFKTLPGFPDATLTATVTQPYEPGTVTLASTVTDPDGTANIQKLEFFSQGALVGTRTSAPWSVSLTNLATGSHHTYALVTDLQGNTGMSPPADFTIQDANADTDEDGLRDAWEMQWFGNLTSQNGAGDADGDKVTNANEWLKGTNPTSAADTDGDSLPDDWEIYWFGDLTSQNGAGHADGDKVTNANEWLKDTNPNSATDTDGDGLPDDWEVYWFDDLTSQNGAGHADGDKVTNANEWLKDTNPTSAADIDGDGLPDDWEIYWFGDLTSQTGTGDPDSDKVTNANEWLKDTDPTSAAADTDADGLPDDWEIYWFGDLTSQNGAGHADGDKVTNANEWLKDTDPTSAADTDEDGLLDDWEVYWFGDLASQNGAGHADGDKVTNANEWLKDTNPTSAADTDEDGLPDDWEVYWFGGHTSQNGSGDPDYDFLSNLLEYTLGTNPLIANRSPGAWTQEIWWNLSPSAVSDFANSSRLQETPDVTSLVTTSDFGLNTGDLYGRRVRGYLIAPVTGDYTFWIASDDHSTLWLSSGEFSPNRQLIASVSGFTSRYAWGASPSQQSSPIHLTAGSRYYIEALHTDAGGADHLAIAWQKPGGVREIIPASAIESYIPLADTDSDGLPDDWENFWFGDLTNQIGTGDPDGDKVTNADEWQKGTEPTSAADTDSDGLPDDWEIFWFGDLTSQTGVMDPDGDKANNAGEWLNGTNPLNAADSDGDGLKDDWETLWFGDLTSQTGTGDADGDSVSNAQEWAQDTDPTAAVDLDNDGLPDAWEIQWFGNLTSQTAYGDPDGDKLTNSQERIKGTNPTSAANIDDDGLPDDWEHFWFGNLNQAAADDPDSDSLTNQQEWSQNSNPIVNEDAPNSQSDTDSDGMPDWWENFYGLNPNDPSDAEIDLAGDGVSNLIKYKTGRNPLVVAIADTADVLSLRVLTPFE